MKTFILVIIFISIVLLLVGCKSLYVVKEPEHIRNNVYKIKISNTYWASSDDVEKLFNDEVNKIKKKSKYKYNYYRILDKLDIENCITTYYVEFFLDTLTHGSDFISYPALKRPVKILSINDNTLEQYEAIEISVDKSNINGQFNAVPFNILLSDVIDSLISSGKYAPIIVSDDISVYCKDTTGIIWKSRHSDDHRKTAMIRARLDYSENDNCSGCGWDELNLSIKDKITQKEIVQCIIPGIIGRSEVRDAGSWREVTGNKYDIIHFYSNLTGYEYYNHGWTNDVCRFIYKYAPPTSDEIVASDSISNINYYPIDNRSYYHIVFRDENVKDCYIIGETLYHYIVSNENKSYSGKKIIKSYVKKIKQAKIPAEDQDYTPVLQFTNERYNKYLTTWDLFTSKYSGASIKMNFDTLLLTPLNIHTTGILLRNTDNDTISINDASEVVLSFLYKWKDLFNVTTDELIIEKQWSSIISSEILYNFIYRKKFPYPYEVSRSHLKNPFLEG